MILPERVFGRSGVNSSMPGRANLPISVATWAMSSVRSASRLLDAVARDHEDRDLLARAPGRRAPMAAASATDGCETSADSTSVVEMRWPETLITSSTRPMQPEVAVLVASSRRRR